MTKNYTKPIVTIDSGMAEGVMRQVVQQKEL